MIPPSPIHMLTNFMIFNALFWSYYEGGGEHRDLPAKNTFLPITMPLCGIIHVVAVHASSIGSRRIHQPSSVMLLESAVYYALAQAIALGLLHAGTVLFVWSSSDNRGEILRVTATICATYYAWFIVSISKIHPNSTLSHLCLQTSMLLYCFGTVPYLVLWGYHHQSYNLVWISSQLFVGLSVADACAFVYQNTFYQKIEIA